MPKKKIPVFDEEVAAVLPNQSRAAVDESETRFRKEVMTHEEAEEECENYLTSLCHPERNEALIHSIKRNATSLAENSAEEIIRNAEPTATDQMLRIAFWEEVKRCERNGYKFKETGVWQGVCTNRYWKRLVREYEHKMAYILIPVRDKVLLQKAIHQEGLQNLLRIANANPFTRKNGKEILDPRIAKTVMDAFKIVDDRMYGQAAQRLNVHKTTDNGKKLSDKQLQEEIEKLRQELGETEPLTIEVSKSE